MPYVDFIGFEDDNGQSLIKRVGGKLQKSENQGQTFTDLGGAADPPSMTALLARGYARLGSAVTPARTQAFAERATELGVVDASGTLSFAVPTGVVGGGFLRSATSVNAKLCLGGYSVTPMPPLSPVTSTPPTLTVVRVPRLISLDETTPFWTSFVFRVNSPGAGNNWSLFGMVDPTVGGLIAAAIGLYSPGPGGLTKFAGYTYNGVAEDDTLSTITVDGGIHTGELWFDGLKWWMSFDQETPIQMTHTHLFTGLAVAPVWWTNFTSAGTGDWFARAAIWPVAYAA